MAVTVLTIVGVVAADSSPAIGSQAPLLVVDVDAKGNTASTLAAAQSCAELDEGDELVADVTVSGVDDLVAWELRLEYDSDVLEIASADLNQMLVRSDPGTQVSPKLFDPETDDRLFLGAGDVRGEPESGSGVLARLTLKAVGPGASHLRIATDPSYFGPRLTNAVGVAIGDGSGDGIWDSDVASARVMVGDDCSNSSPAPTPKPGTPTPKTTQRPGAGTTTATPAPDGPGDPDATPSSGDDDGDDDNGSGGSSGSTSGPVVVGIDPGEDGDGDEPGSQPGNGDPDDPGDDDASSGENDEDGESAPRATGDDGGGGDIIWLVALAAAASVLLGGLILILLRRQRYT